MIQLEILRPSSFDGPYVSHLVGRDASATALRAARMLGMKSPRVIWADWEGTRWRYGIITSRITPVCGPRRVYKVRYDAR